MRSRFTRLLVLSLIAFLAATTLMVPRLAHDAIGLPPASAATGIHKIQHVVVIMMENRSFDEYFGTYPGAVGISKKNGEFTTCLPNPRLGHCQQPYYDTADMNGPTSVSVRSSWETSLTTSTSIRSRAHP